MLVESVLEIVTVIATVVVTSAMTVRAAALRMKLAHVLNNPKAIGCTDSRQPIGVGVWGAAEGRARTFELPAEELRDLLQLAERSHQQRCR